MQRYRVALANTREPHMVGFNVHGRSTDFQLFRYGYASCLLDDGYFCYSDADKGYSAVAWFDEFDHQLGAATSRPPREAWRNGVWRRDFAHGIILVNPAKEAATVELEPGFIRLQGRQAADVNNGEPAGRITIQSKDGIVLRRK
jgi:hypothetical protein